MDADNADALLTMESSYLISDASSLAHNLISVDGYNVTWAPK